MVVDTRRGPVQYSVGLTATGDKKKKTAICVSFWPCVVLHCPTHGLVLSKPLVVFRAIAASAIAVAPDTKKNLNWVCSCLRLRFRGPLYVLATIYNNVTGGEACPTRDEGVGRPGPSSS